MNIEDTKRIPMKRLKLYYSAQQHEIFDDEMEWLVISVEQNLNNEKNRYLNLLQFYSIYISDSRKRI